MAEGFKRFDLSPEVLQGISQLGYEQPTPVQLEAIPKALAGADLVVQSRTGTGKTAAFGIPIVERVKLDLKQPQALILCPTRELALQVARELHALGEPRGVHTTAIYGGSPMGAQIQALRSGAQVVSGTPGRILDHLRQRTLAFDTLRCVVLDEADEMLSMGFYEEVSSILAHVPRERQTLLFSATLAPGVEGLIYHHQTEPVRLSLSSDTLLVREISHYYYVSPTMEKAHNLVKILEVEEPTSAIVFCNTRDEVRLIAGYLRRAGLDAQMISGELGQAQRERVMRAIKQRELRLMVATDVAARGIDIAHLSHVINFSVPESPDVYVHRTGRTGRIGRTGTALTLVGLRELPRFSAIEAIKGITIEECKLPSEEEVLEKRVDKIIAAVRHMHAIATDKESLPLTPQQDLDEKAFLVAAERLLGQGLEPPVLGALLKAALQRPEPAEAEPEEPEPQPAPIPGQSPEAAPIESAETGRPSGRRRRRRPRRRRPAGEPGGTPSGGDSGSGDGGGDTGGAPQD